LKRDALKRKAIKTNKEDDWKLYRSSRNAANAALRYAKNDDYMHIITNKQNPKYAWRTINDILGRNRKPNMINEIKFPEKQLHRQRNGPFPL
jgi:hypothetical protein